MYMGLQAGVSKTYNLTYAGDLASMVNSTDYSTVTDITITGEMDATDFAVLRDQFLKLVTIDLSGVTIMSYYGMDGTGFTSETYRNDEIPESAFQQLEIVSVVLPTSCTSIAAFAFQQCYELQTVTIPSSVKTIGTEAFWGCPKLENVTIPSSLVTLGNSAFEDCFLIGAITIPASTTTIDPNSLNGIIGPITVATGNTNYSSVNGILYDINKTIILQCPTSVSGSYTFPTTVNSIGSGAFSYCDKLTDITISSKIQIINSGAFTGCSANITVDATNAYYSSVDGVLFNKTKTELIQCFTSKKGEYIIPSTVTKIDQMAFNKCSGLTSVTVPSTITMIDGATFMDCTELTSVSLPSTITAIGNSAFYNCNKLVSIALPAGLTVIGPSAFSLCTSFVSFTIPASVTSISTSSFSGDQNIMTMYALAAVPLDLNYAYPFTGNVNSKCVLYVPTGSRTAYLAETEWQDFYSIVEMKTISVSTNVATVAKESGSTATVNVTATTTWTASSNQSWLTVSPTTSASGSVTITVTATKNPKTTTRNAVVTLSATDAAPQTIVVTQNAGVPELVVSETALSIGKEANSVVSVTGTSNTTWYVTSDASWLTVPDTAIVGTATISFKATANTGIARSATVTLKGTGIADQTIVVTQIASDGTPVTELAEEGITFGPNPAKSFITITSNEKTVVTVYSNLSKVVLQTIVFGNETIPVSLPEGLYYIKLQTSKSVITKGIVIE